MWRALGFNADHAYSFPIPAGDAANQSATTHGDQYRVEAPHLLFEFHAQSALAREHACVIIRVNCHRAGLGCAFTAGRKRFSVVVASHGDRGVILSQSSTLFFGVITGTKISAL